MGSLGREPEVGWFPPFFSLWRRPLAVGAKAGGCGFAAWGIFVGGLPPFLSPHPLPLLHSLLIRDFKGHGEGEIGRLCLPTWVLFSRRRCRLWVASGGSPRLGGSHRFFRFVGDRLRSAAKRGLRLCWGWDFCETM